MKLQVFGLLVLLVGTASPVSAEDRFVDAREDFRAELARVIGEVDRIAVRDLYYWEGADPSARDAQDAMIERLLRHEIARIELVPASSRQPDARIVGDVRYRSNLPVAGHVRLELRRGNRGGNTLALPYGYRDGRVYLTNVIREELGRRSKQLTVQIAGMEAASPVKVQLAYVSGDREKTREFVTTTNSSKSFRGQYIKSCRVEPLGDVTPLGLIIREDGEPIYRSGRRETELIYVSKDD